MAPIDPILSTTPGAGIAGLFTAAQTELVIDRVRAHLTAMPIRTPITGPIASPLSFAHGTPATISGLASDTLLNGLNRTVS
jgi:hypothetical protein